MKRGGPSLGAWRGNEERIGSGEVGRGEASLLVILVGSSSQAAQLDCVPVDGLSPFASHSARFS